MENGLCEGSQGRGQAICVEEAAFFLTCTHLYSPVLTCAHLYSPALSCAHLFLRSILLAAEFRPVWFATLTFAVLVKYENDESGFCIYSDTHFL